MGKRLSITAWLLAILAGGLYTAFKASRLYAFKAAFATTYTYNLLFKSTIWLIPLAALLGVLMGTMIENRKGPEIKDGQILRHDEVAFLEHWSHAVSTLLLLVSGIYLGALFVPRLVHRPETVGFALNAHFVGVVIFLFGVAYYLTNVWLAGSMKEHMPRPGDFEEALASYRAKFGRGMTPREGKYQASERLAHLGWVVLIGAIILTGSVKVADHLWDLPGWLMGVTTFFHDLVALGILAFLAAHVVAAAVVPWSWQLLKSMLTGYISEAYVRKNHARWYEEIQKGGERQETPAPGRAGVTKPFAT